MKKALLVSIINLMAFCAILAFVREEFGLNIFIKIFIPAIILFSTNLTTLLMCTSLLNTCKRSNKRQKNSSPVPSQTTEIDPK